MMPSKWHYKPNLHCLPLIRLCNKVFFWTRALCQKSIRGNLGNTNKGNVTVHAVQTRAGVVSTIFLTFWLGGKFSYDLG